MAGQSEPEGKTKQRIKTSLIGFVVGVVVSTSLLFSVSNVIIQNINSRAQTESISDRQIEMIQALGPTLFSGDFTDQSEFLKASVQSSNATNAVHIADRSGDSIFRMLKAGAHTEQLDRALHQSRQTGSPVRFRTSNSSILAKAYYLDGKIMGWIAIETPISASATNWKDTLLLGLMVGCLISAFLIPIIMIFLNRLTKPLYDLIDFAKNVNANQLSARIEMNTGSEFDLLADAFNQMMHRVDGSMRQVQRLAFVDSVTDLPNRERFLRSLARALHIRSDDCFTAVIVLNVDRFRWVNETLGPQKGDEALCLIGMRIRKALAAADRAVRLTDAATKPSMVARLGGDEFAVLVPNIDAKSDITRLMQMIIASMRQPLEIGGQAITLGLSGGISLAPIHGVKTEDLMKNADLALKEARRAGRGTARFYSTKLNKIAMDRMHLEADLRRGIERDEFIPYFQGKVDFKTGAISGAEALVRWQRADGDIISPGIFIPMAEQLGLISQIGESVLRQSCVQATRWMKAGHDCKVAVNVSPLQFEEQDFAERVLSALRDAGLPPGRLELEITETMAVSDTDRVSEIMRPLRAMGVRLAIDDFGAGHSNLVTLTKLPFDVFKIDQQFISALHSDKQAPAVVEMILAMAETMGLETVAEGVETPSQSDFLRRRGCTLAQGYLYSKPIPPEDFIRFLADWRPFGAAADEDFLSRLTGSD